MSVDWALILGTRTPWGPMLVGYDLNINGNTCFPISFAAIVGSVGGLILSTPLASARTGKREPSEL